MSVCVSVPKLTAVGVRACVCATEEVMKLWLLEEEQLKGIFSGLRGRASGSNNFYEYRSKPAGPHSPLAPSPPHPRLGPSPVCLWYAVHVAPPAEPRHRVKGPLTANVVLQFRWERRRLVAASQQSGSGPTAAPSIHVLIKLSVRCHLLWKVRGE